MTINTQPAVGINTISVPVFIPKGSIVTVTPTSGGSCAVEYSLNSWNTVVNGLATWAAWPRGTVTAAASDLTQENVFVRIKPTVQTSVLSWDDQPTQLTMATYAADFASAGSFSSVVQINIGGGVPAALTNPTFQATNNVNGYTQSSVQNKSSGVSSSADHISYPDNVQASDLTGFCDMGITSSGFADALYTVTGQNEAYLFGSAPTASGKSGSIVLATDATGTNNNIDFYVGGFNKAKTAFSARILGSNGAFQIKEGLSLLAKLTVANGATTTYTVPAKTSYVYMTSSAASMAYTLPAAAAAIDGLEITNVTDTSIATVTWSSAGATFAGAPSASIANVPMRMIYDHATLKWYPL